MHQAKQHGTGSKPTLAARQSSQEAHPCKAVKQGGLTGMHSGFGAYMVVFVRIRPSCSPRKVQGRLGMTSSYFWRASLLQIVACAAGLKGRYRHRDDASLCLGQGPRAREATGHTTAAAS